MTLTVLLLVAGVGRAITLAWVCDDAFISFRYAGNLIDGLGLVYNAGERVEGYSNLLWTLLIALSMRAGVDPVRAASSLGIACYLLLVLALAGWSWRRARRGRRDLQALPLAMMVVLAADDFHVWASGGLETMFFTLLGVAAILLSRLRQPPRTWGVSAGVGVLLALLVLTRPDGLLYAPPALVSLWIATGRREQRGTTRPAAEVTLEAAAPNLAAEKWRAVLVATLPLLAALAGLAAWKLVYYGELLPTAFYSKSAALPYLTQGLRYLGLYLAKSWYLLPALALVPWLARRLGRGGAATDVPPAPLRLAREREDRWVFLGTAVFLTAYVVWSGGDFMFARRLVPVAPFLLLALESWIVSIDRAAWRSALAIALVVGAALPYPVFREGRRRIAGIADEPHFYPPEALATRRAQGELVGELLRDTPVRAMFEGGMCMFAYYSKLPYLVEMTGLTQYSLARLPLEERGLIGHEKRADERWLDANGIHLVFAQEWPIAPPAPGARRHDDVYVGNLAKAGVRIYSDPVMDALRGRPEVTFVPIEQVIGRLRAEMEASPYLRAAAIYDYLDGYYLAAAGPRGARAAADLQALLDAKRRGEMPVSGQDRAP